MIVMIFK